ncbi:MAG: hypothetical protein ACE5I3_08960 [Phycisphaerae bacterium]
MRNWLVVLSLLPVLPLGCITSQPRSAVRTSGIEPLREAEFDQFADQLADAITELLKQRDYWPPAIITLPRIEPGGVENSSVARAFAHRLADGLNDRLSGAAFFAKSSLTLPDLRCTLQFVAEQEDPGRCTIVLRLFDEESREELLTESYAYQSRPRVAAVPSARPRKGALKIDAPSDEIGELVLRHAPAFSAWTIAGKVGRVMFLDRKAWERFWLQAQRAARTEDNRLRVELEVRSRRRERGAELRFIFYDEQGNLVDVTPVLPYRFLPHYTKRVTITSGKPGATRYVCLFAYD